MIIKRMHKSRMKDSLNDKVFNIINFTVATIFLILILYPLIYVVSSSLSDPLAVVQGRVRFLPVGITLDGYRAVFRQNQIVTGFLNSLWYMGVGTAINIFFTVLAAYPLSRKDFVDRNKFMSAFAFTMLFSGGMIPTFLLVRNLGLLDTRWALVIPNAFGVFNIIVVRTFFQSTIPDELLESAQMDGCTDFRFLRSVVLPLSGPIIAVQVLIYALGHWNTFFSALIYLSTPGLYPLQLVLREILLLNQLAADTGADIADAERRVMLAALLRYSLIVVSSLPFMLLYPFIQRFFVKGMMIGAIKG